MSSDSDIAVLESRTTRLEKAVEDIQKVMEIVRDRLPNWAVWGFTVAGALIGWLASNCFK